MAENRKSPELATPGTEDILQNSNGPAHSEITVLPQPAPKSLPAAFEDAKTALAECRNIDDAKLLRNKAMALVVFAQQAKDRSLIEDATEIRLRAERRAGEILREMEKNKGGVPGKTGRKGRPVLDATPKLADLGVTKSQSSNWQRLAAIEADALEARVDRAKRKAVNVLDGIGRRTRQELHDEDAARVARLRPVLGSTFLTLLIDYPWKSDWLSETAQATPGYATMAIQELFALPVPQWAAENCHLYFCTPNNFMPLACAAVPHYGFTHRIVITWEKPPPFGQGHYFRNQTEHVLFATKGDLRTRSDSIPPVFHPPAVGKYSEKPERLYQIICEASYLPCGEAFQRKARERFVNLHADAAADDLSIPEFLRRAETGS